MELRLLSSCSKPHHHIKVEIPLGRAKYISITVYQMDRGLAALYLFIFCNQLFGAGVFFLNFCMPCV
jgi:hypothetical protein